MSERKESEWDDIGEGHLMDGVYYKLRHNPCGTVAYFSNPYETYCPKCQPEEFEEHRKIIL